MKIDQAKALIKTQLRMALNKGVYIATLLESGPGIGKSSIVEQAAEELTKELGKPVMCKPFHLTTVEPPDVRGFGLPTKDANGKPAMTFTTPPWAVQPDEPDTGILFLDELGQASHDVQKPAAELLLHRRVGNYQLPPGWIVVAASNRESDRSGVVKQLMHVVNRRMVIKITPDLDAWATWAERNNVHPMAIAFAKYKPGLVFSDKLPEKPGPFCTPRSLCMVSQLIGELGMEDFIECASGMIGEGAAAEFVAFLRVASELPKFEDIVANPDKVPVPQKPDGQYAAMQMVAHRVGPDTAVPGFTYLKRMPKEFQVAGLRSALNRAPQLMHSPEYGKWLRDNKDLVLAANLVDVKPKS